MYLSISHPTESMSSHVIFVYLISRETTFRAPSNRVSRKYTRRVWRRRRIISDSRLRDSSPRAMLSRKFRCRPPLLANLNSRRTILKRTQLPTFFARTLARRNEPIRSEFEILHLNTVISGPSNKVVIVDSVLEDGLHYCNLHTKRPYLRFQPPALSEIR